jgi:hypothetical protein
MSFELTTKVNLSKESQMIVDQFINDNHEKKEVTTHDVFILLAKAAGLMVAMKFDNGGKLNETAQKQILVQLYNRLVKDEANGFEDDGRLPEIIDMIFNVRKGTFDINLGRKGWGCFPCFNNVKVSVNDK